MEPPKRFSDQPLPLLSRARRVRPTVLSAPGAALLLFLALSAPLGCSRLEPGEFDPQAASRRQSLDLIATAQALEARGQYAAAQVQYEEAYEASPRPAALLGLARCLNETGRHAEAEKYLEDFLAQSPNVREAKLLKERASAAKKRQLLANVSAPPAAPGSSPVASPPKVPAPSGRRTVAQAGGFDQANQEALRKARRVDERPSQRADKPKPSEAQEVIPDALRGAAETRRLRGASKSLEDLSQDLSGLEAGRKGKPLDTISGAPYFRRWNSLEARRWRDRIESEEDMPSAEDVREALEELAKAEALAEASDGPAPGTIAAYREELEKEPEVLELPSDELIELAFFSVGPPRPDPGLPSRALAGDSRYYLKRGQDLAAEGKLEQARLAFVEAIERDPRDPVARVELGYLYERLGQLDRAQRQHEAAIRLAPRLARAHYRLGNAHLAQGYVNADPGAIEKAIASYDEALKLDPNHLFSLHNKASALLELGRWQEALPAFEAVRDADPGYNPVYRNLGIIAERHEGEKLKALRYYREYLDLGGEDTTSVGAWIRQIELELSGL